MLPLMNGVKVESSLVHATKDEASHVKLEPEVPKDHNIYVDNFLSMDLDTDGKYFGINDFPNYVEHKPRSAKGGLHSFITHQGEEELNLGALDGILDEIDEVEGDDAAQSLAAACKDCLLDLDFTQEISALNHRPSDKIRIGNSSSDSHSPGCSGSSNGAVVLSESSAGSDPERNVHDGACKITVKCEINVDGNQHGHAQRSEVINHLTTSNPGEHNALWNMKTTWLSVPSNGRNSFAEASVDDMDLRQKRQRKPTRRYIEESTETKSSRLVDTREKFVNIALKGQRPRGRPPSGLRTMMSGTMMLLPVEETSVGVAFGTSSLASLQKGQLGKRENCSEDELGESSYEDESEEEMTRNKSKKGGDRRKHQRMWTLPEVIELVDGISEFGVGRWTQIKRLSFAASPYRTPIDLRDKWRNLLRASCALKPNKGTTGQEKNSGRPLPKSLLRRVRELASLHPYPRREGSRSSSLSIGKKGACSRNLRSRCST